jgi:hypothetical protein
MLCSTAREEGLLDSLQVIFQRLHRAFRTHVGILDRFSKRNLRFESGLHRDLSIEQP